MPQNVRLVEEEREDQPKKKKRRFASDKMERIILVACVLFLLAAIRITMSLAGPRLGGNTKTVNTLEIVWVELSSEVRPPGHDSSFELRIPLAERIPGAGLKPFVVVLRGPWGFGAAAMDNVALALGAPLRRGPGYLVYDLADGKIRLGVLFNGATLAALYLTPNPCPADQPNCEKPYAWGLTKRQIHGEALQPEAPAKDRSCGQLSASGRGFYYVACPVDGQTDEPAIPAVYVQRITPEFRNPPHIRGMTGPPKDPPAPWTQPEHERLLAHSEEARRLAQRALSPGHPSFEFWKFEMGRLLLDAGRPKDAIKPMREAIDALSASSGRDHDDVAAMRLWLPKSR